MIKFKNKKALDNYTKKINRFQDNDICFCEEENKSFKYAWDGIVNFSIKPLRIATVIGALTSAGSFIYLLVLIIKTLIKGIDVPGYASLLSLILLFGGLNLLAIGILGEYIAKMYVEIKRRPIYIAKYTLGFDEDDVL